MLQSLKFLNKENNERAYFLSFGANFCFCFLQKLSKNGRKMSKKDNTQNKIDVCKSALNTILISFLGVCGFIFIQLDTLSTIKFAICILVAFGLILVWTLVFAFFNKYNAQILDE